jgi:hypothetical protein
MNKNSESDKEKERREILQFIRNPQEVNLFLNNRKVENADTLIYDIMTLYNMESNHTGPINEIKVEFKKKVEDFSLVLYIGQDSYDNEVFWVSNNSRGFSKIGGFKSTSLKQYLINNGDILNAGN